MKTKSFYKISSDYISIKKINESEKDASESSHQTHLGLFEGSVKTFDESRTLVSQVIYNDSSYDCLSFIDPIEIGKSGKPRSPKIRTGTKQDDYFYNGIELKSAVIVMLDIINNVGPELNWYILWFEVDTGEMIYLLFNDESKVKNEIENTIGEPIHPNKDLKPWRKKIEPSDKTTFPQILDFLSSRLDEINVEYIEELIENEGHEDQVNGKVVREKDKSKAWNRRRETGRLGEEFINTELEMLKENMLIEEFTWMNKDGEKGEPYDFKIMVQNEFIFIDVKSSESEFDKHPIYITRPELAFISNKEDHEYKVVSVSDIYGKKIVHSSIKLPSSIKKLNLNDDINKIKEKISNHNMFLENLNKLKVRLSTDSVEFEKGLVV